MTIQVTKRDGTKEALDIEKLHKVVWWATENIAGVSASQVEISSNVQFYDGISSTDIQETVIKSAADLISEETPNYQFVAGRLISYHINHKTVFKIVSNGIFKPLLQMTNMNPLHKTFVCSNCMENVKINLEQCHKDC